MFDNYTALRKVGLPILKLLFPYYPILGRRAEVSLQEDLSKESKCFRNMEMWRNYPDYRTSCVGSGRHSGNLHYRLHRARTRVWKAPPQDRQRAWH